MRNYWVPPTRLGTPIVELQNQRDVQLRILTIMEVIILVTNEAAKI